MVVDDHHLFSAGLASLLKHSSLFGIIKTYADPQAAWKELQKQPYDLLFIDMMIPGHNMDIFATHCQKSFPGLKIAVISSFSDPEMVKKMFVTGVQGYLTKDADFAELRKAITALQQGQRYSSPAVDKILAKQLLTQAVSSLTPKEQEIVKLIAAINTVDEIAARLHMSPHTVITHRRNIIRKLKLRSSADIVRWAYENNMTEK